MRVLILNKERVIKHMKKNLFKDKKRVEQEMKKEDKQDLIIRYAINWCDWNDAVYLFRGKEINPSGVVDIWELDEDMKDHPIERDFWKKILANCEYIVNVVLIGLGFGVEFEKISNYKKMRNVFLELMNAIVCVITDERNGELDNINLCELGLSDDGLDKLIELVLEGIYIEQKTILNFDDDYEKKIIKIDNLLSILELGITNE